MNATDDEQAELIALLNAWSESDAWCVDEGELAYWAAEFSEHETEMREREHLSVYGPLAGQD